jgi:hypothetical protein
MNNKDLVENFGKFQNHGFGNTLTHKSLVSINTELPDYDSIETKEKRVILPKPNLEPAAKSLSDLLDHTAKSLNRINENFAVALSRFRKRFLGKNLFNNQLVQNQQNQNLVKSASIPELLAKREDISNRYLLSLDEVIFNLKKFAELFEKMDNDTKLYLSNLVDRVEKLKSKVLGEIYFAYNVSIYEIDVVSKFFNKTKEGKNFIVFKGNYVDELTTFFLAHLFNCGLLNFDFIEDTPHVDMNLLIQNRLYILSCDNQHLELFKRYIRSFTSAGINLEVTLSRFFFDRFDYLNLYFQDLVLARLIDRLLEFRDSDKGILIVSINILDPVRIHKTNEFLNKCSSRGIIDYGVFDLKFLGQENYPTIKKLYLIEINVELLQMFKFYLDYFLFEKVKNKK